MQSGNKNINKEQPVASLPSDVYQLIIDLLDNDAKKNLNLACSFFHNEVHKHLMNKMRFKQIICGFSHNIGITHHNQVYVWGNNDHNQLGIHTNQFHSITKVKLALPENIKMAAAGRSHSVFLTDDGFLYLAGSNLSQKLYPATIETAASNINVLKLTKSHLDKIKYVSCGKNFTAILRENNDLYLFGVINLNTYESLFANIPNVKKISAGDDHLLILTNDGEVYSFGNNVFGQLGLSNLTNQSTFQVIRNIPKIKNIFCCGNSSYLITEDNLAYSFGANRSGQLGHGNKINYSVPKQILGLENVVYIAGGKEHCLFLHGNGTASLCGNNDFGQLAIADIIVLTPTLLPMNNIATIACGGLYSIITEKTGKLFAAGDNSFQQLGIENSTSELPTIHSIYDLKSEVAEKNYRRNCQIV